MGFRSTFVTEDWGFDWPEWFVEKWSPHVNFINRSSGPSGSISSIGEGKTYGVWESLPADIQRTLKEYPAPDYADRCVLVYLHECGGITRCEITPDSIGWSEPTGWKKTKGVEHSYCYGCSDIDEAEGR